MCLPSAVHFASIRKYISSKMAILQLEVQPIHEVAHRRRTMRGCDLVSHTKKFIWGKLNMNPWKRPTPGP